MLQRPAPAQLQLDRRDGAHVLYRDYETRGVLSLGKVGVHRYACRSQNGSVLCCAYAVDDEPVKLWTPGDCRSGRIPRSRRQLQLDCGRARAALKW